MAVEWDELKARRNMAKHGVAFDEAALALEDPFLIAFPDIVHSADEERFLTIGASGRGILVVCAYTERGEAIRIIMARRPTAKEAQLYERFWQR